MSIFEVSPLLAPALVWGLIPRAIGLLYVIAFASLGSQALSLMGRHSPSPTAGKLAVLRRDYPFWLRIRLFPTLLWLNDSDAMVRLILLCGLASGGVAIVGGPLTPYALLVAFVCYLSLDSGGLSFPWDQLLLEAGILGALLPSPKMLPALDATASPAPLTAFAVHFLIARLMLGFAKVKFIGSGAQDRLYLKPFYAWMPMPNPIGLLAYKLPNLFHRASLMFMFVAEVVCPILVLFPGWPRLIGGAGLVALMVGIHFTGNWGFFNVGYVLLCLSLLDTQTTLADFSLNDALASPGVAIHQLVVFLTVGYGFLLLIAFNSWVSRSWVYWPLLEKIAARSRVFGALFAVFRQVGALRIVNAYGVFPPKISPAVRMTPVFEGSDDGETWKRYRYRYLPSHAAQAAPLVAPHHPRFDQSIPYLSGGFSDESLVSSLTGAGTPTTSYLREGSTTQLMKLLLTDPSVAKRLFGEVPTFADDCPKSVRIKMVALSPAPTTDKHPWRERDVGILFDAIHRQDVVPTEGVADALAHYPECSHPDLVYWKARATPLVAMCRRGATDAIADLLTTDSDLTHDDVTDFFTRGAPFLRDAIERQTAALEGEPLGPKSFATTFASATVFQSQFTAHERLKFERILERSAWLLRDRLLPHLWHGEAPAIPRQPAFRTHLVLQSLVIAKDERQLRAALAEPASVVHAFSLPADADLARRQKLAQLVPMTIFRPRQIAYTARIFRWNPIGDFLGGARLPSVLEYFDVLSAIVPDGEIWAPTFERKENGLHDVEAMFTSSQAP